MMTDQCHHDMRQRAAIRIWRRMRWAVPENCQAKAPVSATPSSSSEHTSLRSAGTGPLRLRVLRHPRWLCTVWPRKHEPPDWVSMEPGFWPILEPRSSRCNPRTTNLLHRASRDCGLCLHNLKRLHAEITERWMTRHLGRQRALDIGIC